MNNESDSHKAVASAPSMGMPRADDAERNIRSSDRDSPSMRDRRQRNHEDSDSPSVRSFLDERYLYSSSQSAGDNNDDDESSIESMPSLQERRARHGDDEASNMNSSVDSEYDRIVSVESESCDGEDEFSDDDDDDGSDSISDSSIPRLMVRVEENSVLSNDSSLPQLLERDANDSEATDSDMPPLLRHDVSDDEDSSIPGLLHRGQHSDDDSSLGSMPRLIGRGDSSSSEDEWETALQPSWQLKITSFPQLKELSDDVITHVLSFVADVPFESNQNSNSRRSNSRSATNHESTLTHVLPLVSKHFRSLCQHAVNFFWKEGLERQVVEEPMMWKEGLLQLLPDSHELPNEKAKELVERVFETLGPEDYRQLFQWVVQRYLRITAPVFYMPGFARIGQQIGVHFFEPRYRRLIADVLEPFPESARQGEDIVANEDGLIPTFIYAHTSPFRAGSPACLVRVQHCLIHEDGTADVSIMPLAYVRLERVWEIPDSESLNKAVALRMGREASNRVGRTFTPEVDLLEVLAEGGINGPNFGIRGTINAILAYLATRGDEGFVNFPVRGGGDSDETEDEDDDVDDSFSDDDFAEDDDDDGEESAEEDDDVPMLLRRMID